jgi:hypothetical protein
MARFSSMPGEYHQLFALCKQCQEVFSSSSLVKTMMGEIESYQWHSGPDSLMSGVNKYCHFCTLVLAGIRNCSAMKDTIIVTGPLSLTIETHLMWKSNLDQSRDGNGFRSSDILKISITFAFSNSPLGLNPATHRLDLSVKNTTSLYDHWTPISQAPYRSKTDSIEHIELAKLFTGHCQRMHPDYISSCNDKTNFVPKRLLHLTKIRDSFKVKLHSTDVSDQGASYCCLSHCWGGKQTLSLTDANLLELQNDIPEGEIPPTYLEAIKVTVALGINYLWIDSLCIIQRNESDWIEQAAVMAKIYTNSYCTIAAAGANDCREGCYSTRNPLETFPCRITGNDEDDSLFASCDLMPGCNIEDLERTSTLFNRAWVFQERMLSPRILYFGKVGMAFNCRCLFASETDMNGQAWPSLAITGNRS